MTEKAIEQKLAREVKRIGGLCYKFTSPGNSGVPDRMVILPGGKIHFVELKRPGGKPTDLQLRQMEKLTTCGCDVRVIDSLESVQRFIDEIRPKGGGD